MRNKLLASGLLAIFVLGTFAAITPAAVATDHLPPELQQYDPGPGSNDTKQLDLGQKASDAERGPPTDRPLAYTKADFFQRLGDLPCVALTADTSVTVPGAGCAQPALTTVCSAVGSCPDTPCVTACAGMSPAAEHGVPLFFFAQPDLRGPAPDFAVQGQAFNVTMVAFAYQDVTIQDVLASATPGTTLGATGFTAPLAMKAGDVHGWRVAVTTARTGLTHLRLTLAWSVAGVPFYSNEGLEYAFSATSNSSRIDTVADHTLLGDLGQQMPPRMTFGLGPLDASTSSSPSSAQGIHPADYRKTPIVFIHGIESALPWNNDQKSGGNAESYFNGIVGGLQGFGWPGQGMYTVGYYGCDTDSPGGIQYIDSSIYGDPPAGANPVSWHAHDGHLKDTAVPGFPAVPFDDTGATSGDDAGHDGVADASNHCVAGGHTVDTDEEHIAYHIAWALYHQFGPDPNHPEQTGTCFNVVTHSMGGTIFRYMAEQVAERHPDFPPSLCISSVVTLSAPHNGKDSVWRPCDYADQCDEMETGSAFTAWLKAHATYPQLGPATDWTLLGSEGDWSVPEDKSTYGSNMQLHHWAYWDSSDVEGDGITDVFHNDMQSFSEGSTLNSYELHHWDVNFGSDKPSGDLVRPATSPGRYTDMAMAYSTWGCGNNSNNGRWYIPFEATITGQPFTSGYMCDYMVSVPSGTPHLVVQLTSPSGARRDLYVKNGDVSAASSCTKSATTSVATCDIANPAAGTWTLQVDEKAGNDDPFQILVTKAVPSHLTGVTITSAPLSVAAGSLAHVCWSVAGAGAIKKTELKWGTQAGSYARATPSQVGTAPQSFCDDIQAPASNSVIHVIAHAAGPYDDKTSTETTISVVVPNDCQKNVDAGGSAAAAITIQAPVWSCVGALPAQDLEDWFAVSLPGGTAWSVRMIPNAQSNFNLCVYQGSTQVGCSSAGVGLMDSVTFTPAAPATYNVRVFEVAGSGSYSMSVAPPPNDCGTGKDAGATISTAAAVKVPAVTCPADLSGTDTADYYQFSVAAGATVSADMKPNDFADFDMCLYNPSGSSVQCGSAGQGATESISFAVPTAGNWRIGIVPHSGSGPYHLSIALKPANDCGTHVDAASSATATATPLTPPIANCLAALPIGDTQDWYRITVTSGAAIDVSMQPNWGADYDLCLVPPSGTPLCSTNPGPFTEAVQAKNAVAGTWKISIVQYAGSGNYALSVTITLPPNDCGTRTDAGNTAGTASPIAVPKSSCKGALPADDTDDYYAFTLRPGATVTVAMTPNSQADFDLCLYDPSGGPALCSTSGTGVREAVTVALADGGTWIADVTAFAGAGSYTMTISVLAPPTDCGTGGDAGNTFATATTISLPKANCSAYLPGGDTDDFYGFNAAAGARVTATMTPGSGSDFDLCLIDPAGTILACGGAGGSSSETIDQFVSTTGRYRWQVTQYSGSGIYWLSASLTPPPNDCGTGTDASDGMAGATAITIPATCAATLPSWDIDDWYQFPVSAGATVTVRLLPSSGNDFDLYLVNPAGTYVDQSTGGGSVTDSVVFTAPSAGTWKIEVRPSTGSGPYSLRITVAPQNDCATGGDAGDSAAAASAKTPPFSCNGYLSLGDEDVYRFTASAGAEMKATMTPAVGSDFDLCLLDASGAAIGCSTNWGSAMETVVYTAPASATYYVDVQGAGADDYALTLAVTPQNDCGTSRDAPAARSGAPSIPASTSCGGLLFGTDTSDFFAVTLSAPTVLSVSMTPPAGADFDIYLWSSSGSVRAYSDLSGSGTDAFTATVESGTWYVEVRQFTGSGDYALSLSSSPAPSGDCGTSSDAGNDLGAALAVGYPFSCTGTLADGDGHDVYSFYVGSSGGTLTVGMTPNANSDFDIQVTLPNNSVGNGYNDGKGVPESVTMTKMVGTYYVNVYPYANAPAGTYSLSAS